MTLYYYCKSCKKQNSFKTTATNRFELQHERGSEISERCKRCGTTTKRCINKVHAKANAYYPILATITALILISIMIISTISLSGKLLLPVKIVAVLIIIIPIGVWKVSELKASAFNKVLVSDG